MKKLITAVSLVAASMAAHAQLYGEVGYNANVTNVKENGASLESKPKALRALLGYEFNENFALEGIVGFGISDSNVTYKEAGLSEKAGKAKLNNILGLYLTPKVQIINDLEGFLRLGVSSYKGSVTTDENSYSKTATSTSYGIGVRYMIDSQIYLNADYMSYGHMNVKDKTIQHKGFTIGIGYKF